MVWSGLVGPDLGIPGIVSNGGRLVVGARVPAGTVAAAFVGQQVPAS